MGLSKRATWLMLMMLTGYARGEEEEGDDEEEEEEIDPDMKSTTVMVILTAMVVFSVGFEVTKDKVLEDTKEDLLPVVSSLFAELTVLGFIGLTLFLVDKMSIVGEISEDLYGEEGYIGELCETVHMVLFLVMLIFMGTVVALIQFGNKIAEDWKTWEDDILDDETLAKEYNLIKDKRLCQYQEPEGYQRIAYAAIRQHFLLDIGDENIRKQFDFSGYLVPLLGKTLAEVVEIPISTWCLLEALMVVGWQLQMNLGNYEQVAVLITMGYGLPIFMRIIHNKMRAIKADCAIHSGLMEMAGIKEEEMVARGEDAVEGTPINSTLARSNGYSGLAYVIKPHPCATFVVPQYYDCEHLIQLYGRSNIDMPNHGNRFWFAETKLVEESKEAPDITLGLIRFSLLLNSIYMALFGIGMVPAMLTMVSTNEMSAIVFALIVFFCLLPPISLIYLSPMVVKDFVLVANIQVMRNKRIVEQGIRRIQTRNAFLSLKVIYMMLHGAKKQFAANNEGHNRRKSTLVHGRGASSVTEQKKKRIVWEQIFNIFDDDGEGSLTHAELGELLRMADPNIKDGEVQCIIDELDKDKGGDVDFEEFFEYAELIESRNMQKPSEISEGIFNLVDQGSRDLIGKEEEEDEDEEEEDEIDIQELQTALEKMKQPLSADDVYEVIKDIDEDGNGKLDKEEFHELLIRLDVIPEDDE
jgi:Ca2+-binding EF-hand superfamily protein